MSVTTLGTVSAMEVLESLRRGPIHYTDLLQLLTHRGHDKDHSVGWLIGDLRREGFLVQIEDNIISLPDDVPLRQGAWMRHPEHGVVRVEFYREGFSHARIRKPGETTTIKVHRKELSGR